MTLRQLNSIYLCFICCHCGKILLTKTSSGRKKVWCSWFQVAAHHCGKSGGRDLKQLLQSQEQRAPRQYSTHSACSLFAQAREAHAGLATSLRCVPRGQPSL